MEWRHALKNETRWRPSTREAYAWQLMSFEGWLGSVPCTTEQMEAWLVTRSDAGLSATQLRQAHGAMVWLAGFLGMRAPVPPDTEPVVQLWEAVAWRLHREHGLSPAQLTRLRVAHLDGQLLRYGRRPVRLSSPLGAGLSQITVGRPLSAPLFADERGRPLSPRRLGQHLRRAARGLT